MKTDSTLNAILSISDKWMIKEKILDKENNKISLFIHKKKSLFDFSSKPLKEMVWQTLPLNDYACFIHLFIDAEQSIEFEPWMLKNNSPFPYILSKKIEYLNTHLLKHDYSKLYRDAFLIKDSSVKHISIPELPNVNLTNISFGIPPVENMIWTDLINKKVYLEINSLPLKLLLAKIQMQKKLDTVDINTSIKELKNFFEIRAKSLTHEIAQLSK